MSKVMHRMKSQHVQLRGGVFYFVKRVPADLRQHYCTDRISISLRTSSVGIANRQAVSLAQRLEDYWLGLRLQNADIPAIHLVQAQSVGPDNGFTMTDALALYLRLKGDGRDKIFRRSAERNTEYVIKVLGNKPVNAYSTTDAGKFRDWLIDKGLNRSSVKRVFSSVRAIINLAFNEQGLSGQNGFAGTYFPDNLTSKKRKPIPLEDIRVIQQVCRKMDDDLRWLIALISDTGMRLSEAAGLTIEDIVLDGEIPHVNVRPNPWRSLKTDSSIRCIPLVGASLWAAERIVASSAGPFAFPRYVDGETCNSNSASAALNKWLKAYVPEGCVVHSFRHSLRDRLRAVECPTDIIDQIGGWARASVGEGYGQGYPLHILRSWIDRPPTDGC